MIAIPNMEKPKSCYECPFFILDGAITDDNEWVSYSTCDLLGKTIGDADMLNDCPLIEIEEWNSYGHGKMYAPKGTFQKILDDERRADETDTKESKDM